MAGGKLSARQKMINLMYLVFIAMLAMNMSKEVLSAFGYTNQKLQNNNITISTKNNNAYTNLEDKAREQSKEFGALNETAIKIKKYSNTYYSYLETLKSKMLNDGGIEDQSDYESMDQADWLNSYFFSGNYEDGFTDEGREFIDNINNYRNNLIKNLGDTSKFISSINSRFNTDSIKNSKDNTTNHFLKARYDGFPMVASLTNFTQIQTDIRNTENDIITDLLGGKLETIVSFNNYNGIVKLNKNAYYPGDKVLGTIVLGRVDSNLQPSKVVLNGSEYNNFLEGAVNIDINAGSSTGEKDIKGTIFFKENGLDVPIKFDASYEVIPKPNSAVVSADNMNVVYRGIPNPMSVSLPGVDDTALRITTKGTRTWKKEKGNFLLTPSKDKLITVAEITVKATLEGGSLVNSTSKFRIKDIPAASLLVGGEPADFLELPSEIINNSEFKVGIPDFLFKLNIQTTKFDVFVPGFFGITVYGNKLNDEAKSAISKAKNGSIIRIGNIEARVVQSGYKLPQVYGGTIIISN